MFKNFMQIIKEQAYEYKIKFATLVLCNLSETKCIAFRYDSLIDDAPSVTIKEYGCKSQALIKIAKQNEVSVIYNEPLLYRLYDVLEINDEITPCIYSEFVDLTAQSRLNKEKNKVSNTIH